jgi:hypothetical protein
MSLPDANIAIPGSIHLVLSLREGLLLLCWIVPSDLSVAVQIVIG